MTPKPDPQLSARDLAVLVREMRRAQVASEKDPLSSLLIKGRKYIESKVDKACNQILGEPQSVKGT